MVKERFIHDRHQEIRELLENRVKARMGGGEERIEAQHAKGKLTARERINILLDEGSFEEFDMFVTGPKVTKTVTGEDVTEEDLGGPGVHSSKSGVAHFVSENEEEGLMLIRKLLSFLPENNLEDPPVLECHDPIYRKEDILNDIIPEGCPFREVL